MTLDFRKRFALIVAALDIASSSMRYLMTMLVMMKKYAHMWCILCNIGRIVMVDKKWEKRERNLTEDGVCEDDLGFDAAT